MADEIIPPNNAEDDQEPPICLGSYLLGHTGHDTIHNAACSLQFINELLSEYEGDSATDDVIHGRWLVLSTIVQTLRRGEQQLSEEYAKHREGGDD